MLRRHVTDERQGVRAQKEFTAAEINLIPAQGVELVNDVMNVRGGERDGLGLSGEILVTVDAAGITVMRRADKNPLQLRAPQPRKNEILEHPQINGEQAFMQVRKKKFDAGNFGVSAVYHDE
jgi:hypothetical protein